MFHTFQLGRTGRARAWPRWADAERYALAWMMSQNTPNIGIAGGVFRIAFQALRLRGNDERSRDSIDHVVARLPHDRDIRWRRDANNDESVQYFRSLCVGGEDAEMLEYLDQFLDPIFTRVLQRYPEEFQADATTIDFPTYMAQRAQPPDIPPAPPAPEQRYYPAPPAPEQRYYPAPPAPEQRYYPAPPAPERWYRPAPPMGLDAPASAAADQPYMPVAEDPLEVLASTAAEQPYLDTRQQTGLEQLAGLAADLPRLPERPPLEPQYERRYTSGPSSRSSRRSRAGDYEEYPTTYTRYDRRADVPREYRLESDSRSSRRSGLSMRSVRMSEASPPPRSGYSSRASYRDYDRSGRRSHASDGRSRHSRSHREPSPY